MFCNGQTSDSNLFLKSEIDSEFLILSTKLNQSCKVEGKKRILEKMFSTMEDCYMTISCSYSLITFWD